MYSGKDNNGKSNNGNVSPSGCPGLCNINNQPLCNNCSTNGGRGITVGSPPRSRNVSGESQTRSRHPSCGTAPIPCTPPRSRRTSGEAAAPAPPSAGSNRNQGNLLVAAAQQALNAITRPRPHTTTGASGENQRQDHFIVRNPPFRIPGMNPLLEMFIQIAAQNFAESCSTSSRRLPARPTRLQPQCNQPSFRRPNLLAAFARSNQLMEALTRRTTTLDASGFSSGVRQSNISQSLGSLFSAVANSGGMQTNTPQLVGSMLSACPNAVGSSNTSSLFNRSQPRDFPLEFFLMLFIVIAMLFQLVFMIRNFGRNRVNNHMADLLHLLGINTNDGNFDISSFLSMLQQFF